LGSKAEKSAFIATSCIHIKNIEEMTFKKSLFKNNPQHQGNTVEQSYQWLTLSLPLNNKLYHLQKERGSTSMKALALLITLQMSGVHLAQNEMMF